MKQARAARGENQAPHENRASRAANARREERTKRAPPVTAQRTATAAREHEDARGHEDAREREDARGVAGCARAHVEISGPPADAPAFDLPRFRARALSLLDAARAESAAQLGGAGVAAELSVALVDDATMAALNRAHRGRSGTTDVLAFSLLEGEHREFHGGLLGDVVIAPAVAARQARTQRTSLDDEMLRLLIHGVLHLLGHDHERAGDARVMRTRERELWERVSE